MKRRLVALTGIGLVLCCGFAIAEPMEDPNPPSIHSDRGAWPLARQWTPAETDHYARWLSNMYRVKRYGTLEQRLAKLEAVLTDPQMNLLLDPAFAGERANPPMDLSAVRTAHQVVDCGKLTIALGAYYAHRRGLPWMQTQIRSGDGTDIRQSAFNTPVRCVSSFEYNSVERFFVDCVYGFCTGNYRIEPGPGANQLSDTVPVAITRDHLKPGAVFYQDGHVMLVAHVDEYGEPFFLESTTAPGRDIYTHSGLSGVAGVTSSRFGNGGGDTKGWYRGFRIQRYPIAVTNESGLVLSVRRRTDEEMAPFGYSIEQYEKISDMMAGGRIMDGEVDYAGFHAFIRGRLRTVEQVNPFDAIETFSDEFLQALERREEYVQAAWREVQGNGGIPFPEGYRYHNIFNTGSAWSRWSTAGYDTDCRREYAHLLSWIEHVLKEFEENPAYVDLSDTESRSIWGSGDLALVLGDAKDRVFAQKKFTYINSKGNPVELTLADIEDRLDDLSFDPNHPPELRWGAKPGSPEARTAPERSTPLPSGKRVSMAEAYRLEAYYRTLVHRDGDMSYLEGMFTEGYPQFKLLDQRLENWMVAGASPPIIPRGGKLASLAVDVNLDGVYKN